MQLYQKSSNFDEGVKVRTWEEAARGFQYATNMARFTQLRAIKSKFQKECNLPEDLRTQDTFLLHKKNLEFFKLINDVRSQAETLREMASIQAEQGNIDNAITLYKQSIVIYENTSNIQRKAETLTMIGKLLANEKRDITTALKYLQDSLAIYQQLHYQEEVETVRGIITNIEEQKPKSP